MIKVKSNRFIAAGEVMIEMAPLGEGMYRQGFAGDTFNTAWHLARLLGDKGDVSYATRVGSDAISEAFICGLTDDGIDTSLITRDPDHTMGLYLIELEGAERSFQYWRNASAARFFADRQEWLEEAFEGAGLIHLSGITVAILCPASRKRLLAALEHARSKGACVSFDPNIRPRLWSSKEEILETIPMFLDMCDIALPSFDDEHATWGDASPDDTIERHAKAGVREIVVKNGAGAVRLFSDGMSRTIDTPPVRDIRDTTGAGDAFNAGYLAARMTGQTPAKAVATGQALSGKVIAHFGARLPKQDVQTLPFPE